MVLRAVSWWGEEVITPAVQQVLVMHTRFAPASLLTGR